MVRPRLRQQRSQRDGALRLQLQLVQRAATRPMRHRRPGTWRWWRSCGSRFGRRHAQHWLLPTTLLLPRTPAAVSLLRLPPKRVQHLAPRRRAGGHRRHTRQHLHRHHRPLVASQRLQSLQSTVRRELSRCFVRLPEFCRLHMCRMQRRPHRHRRPRTGTAATAVTAPAVPSGLDL